MRTACLSISGVLPTLTAPEMLTVPDVRHPAATISAWEVVCGVPELVIGIEEVEPLVIMLSIVVVLGSERRVVTMRMSREGEQRG